MDPQLEIPRSAARRRGGVSRETPPLSCAASGSLQVNQHQLASPVWGGVLPGEVAVGGMGVGAIYRAQSFGAHREDLPIAFPMGLKGDLRAVGRPGGVRIGLRVVHEAGLFRAVQIHPEDLVVQVVAAPTARIRALGTRNVRMIKSSSDPVV